METPNTRKSRYKTKTVVFHSLAENNGMASANLALPALRIFINTGFSTRGIFPHLQQHG